MASNTTDTEKAENKVNVKRSAKLNKYQKDFMVSLLENCPIVAKGQITPAFTFIDQKKKWEEISRELNKYGCVKTGADWKKTWQDMRSKAKAAKAALRRSSTQTGGGEGIPADTLSPLKERILAISGGDTITEGHAGIEEFGIGETETPSTPSYSRSTTVKRKLTSPDFEVDSIEIESDEECRESTPISSSNVFQILKVMKEKKPTAKVHLNPTPSGSSLAEAKQESSKKPPMKEKKPIAKVQLNPTPMQWQFPG
ncbi:uncharacterized protein LOC135837752 [Planococcus citri]|uniref:uncharacterized protein LOC135837752 n=1 Tax=Planococcus citri TaxID=170843 RepID=UPI0031F84AF0